MVDGAFLDHMYLYVVVDGGPVYDVLAILVYEYELTLSDHLKQLYLLLTTYPHTALAYLLRVYQVQVVL